MDRELGVVNRGSYISLSLELASFCLFVVCSTMTQKFYHQGVETSNDPYYGFLNTFCSVLLGFDTTIAPMGARRNGPLVTFVFKMSSQCGRSVPFSLGTNRKSTTLLKRKRTKYLRV